MTNVTIKQFTDSSINGTTDILALKLIKTRAAQEHLQHQADSLQRDSTTIKRICQLVGIQSESDIWDIYPVIDPLASDEKLHYAYLILLGRTLLRSTNPDTSDAIRFRFATAAIMAEPVNGNLTKPLSAEIRAKMINLLELHGDIKAPSAWQNFLVKLQGWFTRKENVTA